MIPQIVSYTPYWVSFPLAGGFPIGTIVALYTWDKLSRGKQLFVEKPRV